MKYNKGNFISTVLAALYQAESTGEPRYICALASGYNILRQPPDTHIDYYKATDRIVLFEYNFQQSKYSQKDITYKFQI